MPRQIDLVDIMVRASSERWCVNWGCTTCGSQQIRATFKSLLAEHTAQEIASALATVDRDFHFASAEWLLRALSDPWSLGSLSSRKLLEILGSSLAGLHYKRMLDAKAAADARRKDHDLRNDPDEIIRRREEKKRQKAEDHQKRLDAKKARDAVFHAQMKDTRE